MSQYWPKKSTSVLSLCDQAQQSISSSERRNLICGFLKLFSFSLITTREQPQSEPDCVFAVRGARLPASAVDLEVEAHQCKTDEEAAAQLQPIGKPQQRRISESTAVSGIEVTKWSLSARSRRRQARVSSRPSLRQANDKDHPPSFLTKIARQGWSHSIRSRS